MKLTKKQVAYIARCTKDLPKNGLGITAHFYLEPDGGINSYEDVSGREEYPGETGEYILSATFPLTQGEVREIVASNERQAKEFAKSFEQERR